MDLFQADKSVVGHLGEALIDWSTPPIIKNNANDGDLINNNPFDIMESKAFNMDPFDLVSNETPIRKEPPFGNIWSPLWELKSKPLQTSESLTDINGVARILECVEIDKSKDDHNSFVNMMNEEVVDQSTGNCDQVLIENNKMIENGESKIESVLTEDFCNEIDIEKRSMCNEDEKKQIREQTQLRIKMLIEKGHKDYEEELSRKSQFCTPIRNPSSSLNKSESLFNKGFLQSGSNSNSYDESSYKTPENVVRCSDSNKSSNSFLLHESQLHSFDLNSVQPEWELVNLIDSDSTTEVQINDKLEKNELTYNNNDIDTKLKALNRIGIIESKSNACRIFKSMQNKKSPIKGPFLANVPLQHMVQNCKDDETKEIFHAPISPRSKMKPVASSTPTNDIIVACKTPSTVGSSIKSGTSVSRRSMPNVDSPSTPLNVTKCIRKTSTYNVDGNKLPQLNVSRSVTLATKRSNTTIVLYGGENERKLKMAQMNEKLQTFHMNKSKSLSKIGKISNPMALSTNKTSGLPIPKRFSNAMSFKGKENMAPQ